MSDASVFSQPSTLELATEMGIEPNDPLLLVIRENHELAQQTQKIQQEMQEWAGVTRQLLQLLTQEKHQNATLAQNYSKLTNILSVLEERWSHSNELTRELNTALSNLPTDTPIGTPQESLKQQEQLNHLNQKLDQLTKTIETGPNSPGPVNKKAKRDSLLKMLAVSGILCYMSAVIAGIYIVERPTIVEIKQGMGWLLKKANRLECHQGIHKLDDPECKQFQTPK
jgi:hypothetical protein